MSELSTTCVDPTNQAIQATISQPETMLEVASQIALDIRVSYINPQDLTAEQNAAQIFKELSMDERQFYRLVDNIGIEPQTRVVDGLAIALYPPFTKAALAEETSWRESFYKAPRLLKKTHIEDIFGWGTKQVNVALTEVGADDLKTPTGHYLQKVLYRLRLNAMSVPGDHGWISIEDLMEFSNRNASWISRHLPHLSQRAEERRSSSDGMKRPHVPMLALKPILDSCSPVAVESDGWHTKEQILALGIGKHSIDNALELASSVDVRMVPGGRGFAIPQYSGRLVKEMQQHTQVEQTHIHDRPKYIDNVFTLGSIQSQIRARRNMLRILRQHTNADPEQLTQLQSELGTLTRARNAAHQRVAYAEKQISRNSTHPTP